jgi:hypothetical protein
MSQMFLSDPVPVHWAGFESDTYRLQHAGWQISANEDYHRDELAIALLHPKLRARGITNASRWHYAKLHGDPRYGGLSGAYQPLRMEWLTDQPIYSAAMARMDPELWRAIDATPTMRLEQPRRIEDIVHFAPVTQKQVILPPESVPELMEKILKLQDPMREKYFQDQAKEARGRATVHAQILSFAG